MIPYSFYVNQDILDISKKLLGKRLHSKIGGVETAGIIVETEAYRGSDDKACHAYGGNRSPRSLSMYKEGGHAYVYICYGIHPLFNIVTSSKGKAEVVLIRALQPVKGIEEMKLRRNQHKEINLCNGPGKLTQALGITKLHNEAILYNSTAEIWLEEGMNIPNDDILTGPRVGLSTAQECMNWPWRFRIKGNKFTSKPNTVYYEGYP